jgi:hypothetical protein
VKLTRFAPRQKHFKDVVPTGIQLQQIYERAV